MPRSVVDVVPEDPPEVSTTVTEVTSVVTTGTGARADSAAGRSDGESLGGVDGGAAPEDRPLMAAT
jgi:hypothetical protein